MDDYLPKFANFACGPTKTADEEGIAHDFGFNFQLKGNFTFTWMFAVIKHVNLLLLFK